MRLPKTALILSIIAFAPLAVKANIGFNELKEELNNRSELSLAADSFPEIDTRTRKQKKAEAKQLNKLLSRKLGPLELGVQVRGINNSNLNFKLDLLEAYEALNQKHSLLL